MNREVLALQIRRCSFLLRVLDPDKEGAQLWQYHAGEGSIWGGIQWGAAVDGDRAYFPVSDIRTPKPGGLHAVSLTTGERAWYVPPPPLKCASGAGLYNNCSPDRACRERGRHGGCSSAG